jgi:hypothetical protein
VIKTYLENARLKLQLKTANTELDVCKHNLLDLYEIQQKNVMLKSELSVKSAELASTNKVLDFLKKHIEMLEAQAEELVRAGKDGVLNEDKKRSAALDHRQLVLEEKEKNLDDKVSAMVNRAIAQKTEELYASVNTRVIELLKTEKVKDSTEAVRNEGKVEAYKGIWPPQPYIPNRLFP